MSKLRILSAAAQVAEHLRRELLAGKWSRTMPGGDGLAADLGVGVNTVEAALRQLEAEGLLVNQGRRRGRLIRLPDSGITRAALRVAVLANESADFNESFIASLPHDLEAAGHVPVNPGKSMHDLKMDIGRIAQLVNETAADAWVVVAGSREVLEWFSARDLPIFALFGRRTGLPIAGTGPDNLTPYLAATRQMIALGHRRIVNICRRERRVPIPGNAERAFLAELAKHDIPSGDYNLPDWQETGEGLRRMLGALFQTTPPTALIFDEAPILAAALQFLAQRNIQVPGDVSLFCIFSDPTFALCVPPIAEIRWDHRQVTRGILRWANRIAKGREDRRQTLFKAEFVPGGTIGRVAGGKA
jgi:DNA-binding LacI/PurR family transcriptional regulator/DNA-binding transcriptional regulator YhcF (GntR family)